MFERDYLMNMLMQFFRGMLRANELRQQKEDPDLSSRMLEDLIQESLDMDGVALLQLSSESIAQVMRVTGVDPRMTEFIARSLLLDALYLEEANKPELAAVRTAQAFAIAQEYGFELPDDLSSFEGITAGLEEEARADGERGGSIDLDTYTWGV